MAGTLTESLAKAIDLAGPIPVAHYMAAANTHYYATRDPFGSEGDFITAPEISQMFGEMIGLWLTDLWLRMGKPVAHYVELGPGRGTLAVDALRAMAMVGLNPSVHLVETSPVLRMAQQQRLPHAKWHDDISTLPADGVILLVANEFFDALPIHQLMKAHGKWFQGAVTFEDGRFLRVPGALLPDDIIPDTLRNAPDDSIIESASVSVTLMRALAEQIARQGGAGVVIDYGYDGPAVGDTLQAVKGHEFADVFVDPGEQDLTTHVDFGTIGAIIEMVGAKVHGPIGQGQWLARLGLTERTAALSAAKPEKAAQFAGERDRLCSPDGMGRLFRVMGITAPGWPNPDGF
jgi:NADH dehydrogenase [ubiquinone] 1 alpha subcomplex assembly factor 7